MQGIYTDIPETIHVPREHCVAAILLLLFMVLISLVPALTPLYLYVSTFRSMCEVPNMAVFCSSLNLWCPGMLLTYLYNAACNTYSLISLLLFPLLSKLFFVLLLYVSRSKTKKSLLLLLSSSSSHIVVSLGICNTEF